MGTPFLSIIIPAYNEELRIGDTVHQLIKYLSGKPYPFEIVVADDGSDDDTATLIKDISVDHTNVTLLSLKHGGKGSAVRQGMLSARGTWLFMCDADLSMPVEQIDRFLPGKTDPGYDIGIGSREVTGAKRHSEPFRRHLMGRAFNWVAQVFALWGIKDTQCGFKMFRGILAKELFVRQKLNGFGFDVELLYLARLAEMRIEEIGIDWYYRSGSSMTPTRGARGFLDIVNVRWNHLRGRYRAE